MTNDCCERCVIYLSYKEPREGSTVYQCRDRNCPNCHRKEPEPSKEGVYGKETVDVFVQAAIADEREKIRREVEGLKRENPSKLHAAIGNWTDCPACLEDYNYNSALDEVLSILDKSERA